MKKKKVIIFHVFIWLFAIFANLPFLNFGKSIPASQVVTSIFAFLYLMVVFYFFYFFMVPKFLNDKKPFLFFLYSFFVVLLMPFFGYTLLFAIRSVFSGSFHGFYKSYSLKLHMSGYTPVLVAAVFGSFFRVIINWFGTLSQKAELDKEKMAVELDLMKSKLNPHFLFNTLNNIDSLIQTNQSEASSALLRLSDIMRYMTYETTSDKIELEREVDYIRNLIELHRIRIKNPGEISLLISGDLKVRIAPALFVPMIENAFKYASFRNKKPAIDIRLTSGNGNVVFFIKNFCEKIPAISGKEYSGSGINNLKKRLDLIYPGRHQFSLESDDSIFITELTINTDDDQMHSH